MVLYFLLTLLAVCHTRRLTLIRKYSDVSSDGPDVIQEKAPPSYDDGM